MIGTNRLILLLLLLTACSGPTPPFGEAAIRQVMIDQEAAWNAGDIDGFMQGYSDTICFIGSGGRTCGRDAVAGNYKRNYPDGAAMGDLTFGIDEVVPAGNSNAWVTGTWALDRESDTLQGGFSLLWARETDGWKIVRDHSY